MTTIAKRTLFLVLLASLGFASSSVAQGFGSPEQRAERAKAQIEEVINKVGLEGEKAEQVRGILLAQSEEQFEIFQAYAGQQDRSARQMMREEMTELRDLTDEKLATVLSEDELKVYKEIQAEAMERRRGRAGGRRGGGTPNPN